MTLLGDLFGAPAVNEIFSPSNTVQRMLDFEAALATAEVQLGIIPTGAAGPIRAQCRADRFDLAALADGCARAGNLAIPMIQQLTGLVAAVDTEAAQYVHWGATSQDTIDTGLALQLRDALALIGADLDRLRRSALDLADRYRSTPIVARTWMQHAVPTALGLQFAGWADALGRHAARLAATRRLDVALQLGGAAGTLATLDGRGVELGAIVGAALELTVPAMPWHAHRDRIAAVATTLALLGGTLGKIARDLALQSQIEVAELSEPAEIGRGISSTMPHKRNPVAAAVALAAAIRIPSLASGIVSGMVQEHERGLGGWQAEWESVPELVRLAAGSLHHLMHAVGGLDVDAARMHANLETTGGLIYSESVTQVLARHIGRPEARSMVVAAAQRAVAERRHLRDVLAADASAMRHLTSSELATLFEPSAHVRAAQALIDRVLDSARSSTNADDGQ
jgi:3-carboxy-cis,cis-muconate cycloisomerase